MLDEEHDRWARDKMRATLDELPSWPVVGPTDSPLISIAIFAVRRTKEASKSIADAFNQRDYEVALVRPRGSNSAKCYHQLPSSPMLSGETSHQAVLRVAQGTIGLPAANVLKIKSTATPLRVDGAPVVTMLYFVSSAHPFHDLQSGAGSDASYFNLQTLTNGFAPVQFVLDHRELLRAAAGWLNSKFMTEQLPALFASQVMVDARRPGGDPSVVSKRVLLSTVENPMFNSGYNNMLEQSTVSYTSKYFAGGLLKPGGPDSAPARRASKAIRMPRDSQAFVEGVPQLDVLAEATTDDMLPGEYFRAHPSERRAAGPEYAGGMSIGQMERTFKAFELMDINGDGEAVDMPEIQLALKKGNIEVNELMNLLDHDNSGSISVIEFLKGIRIISQRDNLPPSLEAKMTAAAATGTKKRNQGGADAGPARPSSVLTADYDPTSNPVSPASTQFGFSDDEDFGGNTTLEDAPATPQTTWLGKEAQTPAAGFPLTPPALPPQPAFAPTPAAVPPPPPAAAQSPAATVLSGPHAGTVRLSTLVREKIERQAAASGEPEAHMVEAAMPYKAKKKKELNVEKGSFIILQEKLDEPYKSDSAWLCGSIGIKKGYFKAHIVKKKASQVPGNAPTSPLMKRDFGFMDAAASGQESVEAIKPYRAKKKLELNVEKGDIIILQEKEHAPYVNDDAWLRGSIGLRNGYFEAGIAKTKTYKATSNMAAANKLLKSAATGGFQSKRPANLSLPNTAELIAGPTSPSSPTLTDWGSPGGIGGFSPPSFPTTRTKDDPFSPAGFSPSGISTGSFSPDGFPGGGGNGWAAAAAAAAGEEEGSTLDDFAPPANEMFAEDLNADFSNPLFG